MRHDNMDKDTFLKEMAKLRARVNLAQVAKDIDMSYRSVQRYVDGERQKISVMVQILEAARNQIRKNCEEGLALVGELN